MSLKEPEELDVITLINQPSNRLVPGLNQNTLDSLFDHEKEDFMKEILQKWDKYFSHKLKFHSVWKSVYTSVHMKDLIITWELNISLISNKENWIYIYLIKDNNKIKGSK